MANVEISGVMAGVAGVATGFLVATLNSRTRRLNEKAACLRAARRATDEFYDLAERLLSDAATPDRLKQGLYDLTLAVTDKEAGRIAFEATITWLEKADNATPQSTALDSDADVLRKNRGDLYDDFLSALRAAFAALMFSYGPDHSKVMVEFEATRNQSIMFALMSRIDRVLSDWIAAGGERRQGVVARAA